jgi:hypothetical protein
MNNKGITLIEVITFFSVLIIVGGLAVITSTRARYNAMHRMEHQAHITNIIMSPPIITVQGQSTYRTEVIDGSEYIVLYTDVKPVASTCKCR